MANTTVPENDQRDAEQRRQVREERRKNVHEQVTRDRAEQERFNNEKMQREAGFRPTPTPEEILKAQSGAGLDEKEPDGSPEQNPNHPIANAAQQIEVGRKIAEAKPAGEQGGGYQTRAQRPAHQQGQAGQTGQQASKPVEAKKE